MTRSKNKIIISAVMTILAVFMILFVKNGQMKAYASDTNMKVSANSITLDTQYDTYYDLKGTISGDTGSSYYVYGVDENSIVSTNSPSVSGDSFTIRITALKKGSTSLKLCVKDTNAKKVVATTYVDVTVRTVDVSGVELELSKTSASLEIGKSTSTRVTLMNYPTSLGTYWDYQIGDKSIVSASWGEVTKDGTTKYRDIIIKGLKQGSTTVKVLIQGMGSKKTIREATIKITVDKSYSVSDVKLSLAKTSASIQTGEAATIRAQAENLPGSLSATWKYTIANTSYVSASWTNAQRNGSTAYNDLVITGLKAGKTTVKVQFINNSSGAVIKEGTITVTVSETNMTFSLSKTKLDIRSGEKTSVTVKLGNCPTNCNYEYYSNLSAKGKVYTEWGNLTGNGTTGRTAECVLYGVNSGTVTLKIQVKISGTSTVLKEGSVTITVKSSFFKSGEKTSYDLKNVEGFTLDPYMTIPTSAAEYRMNVSVPQNITLTSKTEEIKTVSGEKRKYYNCKFSASKAGSYEIKTTLEVKCGGTFYISDTLSYIITLTDSRTIDDISFTVSKTNVNIDSGNSDTIRVQADNCPTSPNTVLAYECDPKSKIIAVSWKNESYSVNGSTKYNDIIVKGIGPGTETIKVRIKNADTNEVIEEKAITVTVEDHNIDELTLNIDKTYVTIKPDGKETVKVSVDNCPSTTPIVFVYKLSDTEHITAQWGEVQKDADVFYDNLTFGGVKIGMTNVTVMILEKETEKVLKQENITVCVSDSDIKFSISDTDLHLERGESTKIKMSMENCRRSKFYTSEVTCSNDEVAYVSCYDWNPESYLDNAPYILNNEVTVYAHYEGTAVITVQIIDYDTKKAVMEYTINVTVGSREEITATLTEAPVITTTTTTTISTWHNADDDPNNNNENDIAIEFDDSEIHMMLNETGEIVMNLYNCPLGGNYHFRYISDPLDDFANIEISNIIEYEHEDEELYDYQIMFQVQPFVSGTTSLTIQMVDVDTEMVIAEGTIEVAIDTEEYITTITDKPVTTTTTTTTATSATAKTTAKTTKSSAKTSKTTTSTETSQTTPVQTTEPSVTTPELIDGYYGECGENVMWSFDESKGELVIFGEGAMKDYESYNEEWAALSDKIKSIKVTEGVTSIGAYAFSYMNNVEKIELPSTLTEIKEFSLRATNIENIIIPDNVTEIGERAFTMSKVKRVKLSNGMTEIAVGLFDDCQQLESVEIPESITAINEYAFLGCTSLESIIVSEQVEKIGNCAFLSCFALKEITIKNPNCIIEEEEERDRTIANENTVINGYVDSTAYKYAEGHYNKFISLEDDSEYEFGHVKGDANGDGKVNVRDAAFIAAKLAQGRSGELPLSADFNGDEKINVRDAAAIAKFLATGK